METQRRKLAYITPRDDGADQTWGLLRFGGLQQGHTEGSMSLGSSILNCTPVCSSPVAATWTALSTITCSTTADGQPSTVSRRVTTLTTHVLHPAPVFDKRASA